MSTLGSTTAPLPKDHGPSAFHEIAPLSLQVRDPQSLDVLGRALSAAVTSGDLNREQASILLLEAIPQSAIIRQVMRSRLQPRAVQGHGDDIEVRVMERLREKVEKIRPNGDAFLDWSMLADRSTAAWVRHMSHLLVCDATKSMVRSGQMFTVSTEDGPMVINAMRPDPPAEVVSETERQMDVVDSYEDATTDARGRKRRLTPAARIHLNAEHLLELNQWPAPVRPLTWAEREEVRVLLEEDPQAIERSLRGDGSVPVALEAMWDPFDEHQRQTLLRRPEQAVMVAMAAVTPLPRPRREATINSFRRAVSALSKDVQWRRQDARHLADAWLGVYLDLTTYQSRGSAALMEEREAAAAKGRAAWDVLMASNRPPQRLRQVARTSSDLSELLMDLWIETINDPAERAIELSHQLREGA